MWVTRFFVAQELPGYGYSHLVNHPVGGKAKRYALNYHAHGVGGDGLPRSLWHNLPNASQHRQRHVTEVQAPMARLWGEPGAGWQQRQADFWDFCHFFGGIRSIRVSRRPKQRASPHRWAASAKL